MNSILELIKTLIPFGIAFLFLWGIGRICCKNSAKPKQPDRDKKPKKTKNKKPKSNNQPSESDAVESKLNFQSHKESRKSIRKTEDQGSGLDEILSLPEGKQKKLTSLQKAFLLKEALDSPKALKPYRRKYPR